MKNKSFLACSLGIVMMCFTGTVTAQNFDYGQTVFAGPYNDVARDVACLTNSLGYKITVGSYQPTSASGTYNGFVKALDANEDLEWWIDIQGSGNDEVMGVDVRAKTSGGIPYGDIYITGYFTGSVTMVLHSGFPIHDITSTIMTRSATSGVSNDATYFVTKLNQDGGHIWTQIAGTSIATNYNTEIGNDVDVNVIGSEVQVYTTGFFRGSQNFYSSASPIAVSGSSTQNAAFTAKYIDNGTTASCSWVNVVNDASNNQHDYGYGVVGDINGNVFMTGSIGGNATVGSTAMTVSGNDDALVVKYNSSGTPQWAMNFGGNGAVGNPSDQGRGIDVRDGNVYVSGYYYGSGTFTNTPTNSTDAFVVKIADGGTSWSWVWKNKIISSGSDFSYRLTLSKDGSLCYVVGSMGNNIVIKNNADVTIGSISSYSSGAYANSFMVVLYTNGSYYDSEWLADDNDASVSTGVAWFDNKYVFTCGAYKSYFLYDASTNVNLTNYNTLTHGLHDAFLTRYDSGLSPRLASPQSQNTTESDDWQGSVYPNPSNGQFMVSTNAKTETTFDVIDLTGRCIMTSQTMTSQQMQLDLTTVPAGVYFVRLHSDDAVKTIRIVKE